MPAACGASTTRAGLPNWPGFTRPHQPHSSPAWLKHASFPAGRLNWLRGGIWQGIKASPRQLNSRNVIRRWQRLPGQVDANERLRIKDGSMRFLSPLSSISRCAARTRQTRQPCCTCLCGGKHVVTLEQVIAEVGRGTPWAQCLGVTPSPIIPNGQISPLGTVGKRGPTSPFHPNQPH